MATPRNANGSTGGKGRSETSDLAQRIAKARGLGPNGTKVSSGSKQGDLQGLGRAARLGTEFIAAVLVGAGIGYGLDLLLDTTPWMMLVMLLVGFSAGILNVVRAAAQMNAANPAPLDADLGPNEHDEDELN